MKKSILLSLVTILLCTSASASPRSGELQDTVTLTDVVSGVARVETSSIVTPEGWMEVRLRRSGLPARTLINGWVSPEALRRFAAALNEEHFASLPAQLGIKPVVNYHQVALTVGPRSVAYRMPMGPLDDRQALITRLKSSSNPDERHFGFLLSAFEEVAQSRLGRRW